MSSKTFVVQKISEHGASHPIVARLSIQTIDMLQWMRVSDAQKSEVLKTCIDLQRRLLQCDDIYVRLDAARAATLKTAEAVRDKGDNTLPFLIGLQEEAESFLSAAKQYLREFVRLINALYVAGLDVDSAVFWDPKGGDSRVATWSAKAFGKDHEMTLWLASQSGWIGEIARKRNAVEHPGDKSGTLVIQNYASYTDGKFLPPCWQRQGGQQQSDVTDLMGDLRVFLDSMLIFAEEVIATGIKYMPVFPQIQIFLIAPEQRNPQAPVRLKASVDLSSLGVTPN